MQPTRIELRRIQLKLLQKDYDRNLNEFLFKKFENIVYEIDNSKIKKQLT